MNNLNVQAKFLPAAYLAYKEIATSGEVTKAKFDSTRKDYRCGLTFEISIKADNNDPKYGRLVYYNVGGQAGYNRRVQESSFKIAEYMSLAAGGNKYSPVLAHYEGYNELANKVVFQLVFVPEEYDCGEFKVETDKLKLTYDDPFWDLGINHFTFDIKGITGIPLLKVRGQ